MNVHQYLILQKLAADLRMNDVASAYVDFNAESGEMHPRVTYAAADPDLGAARAEPRLSGANLAHMLSTLAGSFLDRRLPDWKEGAGSRGQMVFDASGALLLDVSPRNGCSVQSRITEVIDLTEPRQEALHSSRVALLRHIALEDDQRLARLIGHRALTDAADSLAADMTPGDPRLSRAAQCLWDALPGVAKMSLSLPVLTRRIEDRLFADLSIRQAPWFAGSVYDRPAAPQELPEGLGKAPLWLQLDALEAERLFKLIEESHDPILCEIRAKMEIGLSNIGADEAFRDATIEKYASRLTDGDVDFQPDGLVSKSDEGAYVMAFLWVSNAEAGLEDPTDDPGEDEELEP